MLAQNTRASNRPSWAGAERGRRCSPPPNSGAAASSLAFNPDTSYFDALATHRDGLNERDMIVPAFLQTGYPSLSDPPAPPIFVLTDDGGRVADAYGVPADGPFFCLIGKDGTVKQAGQDLPTAAEIFEMIDAMPMRRQEVRERERQGGG